MAIKYSVNNGQLIEFWVPGRMQNMRWAAYSVRVHVQVCGSFFVYFSVTCSLPFSAMDSRQVWIQTIFGVQVSNRVMTLYGWIYLQNIMNNHFMHWLEGGINSIAMSNALSVPDQCVSNEWVDLFSVSYANLKCDNGPPSSRIQKRSFIF